MTGGGRTPSRPAPGLRFTLWANHAKIGRWLPILTGLDGPVAVEELWTRQDRLRRSNEPCRLVLLEDGKVPQ